ncbi:MAG: hypothetical protein KDD44_13475, partial [Bdellovibrionales bacterium]|nr:hypothetical protein [Bdellovibrionales bacterium]
FLYGHLGHPQLRFAFFIPGAALAALVFAETRSFFSATAIGFCVFAQFFSTVYYSLIAYVLAGLILLSYGMLRFRTIALRDIGTLFTANVPWAIGIAVASGAYRDVRETFGAFHPSLIKHFQATFGSYLAASEKHFLWGWLAPKYARNGAYLTPGVTVLALAAIAVGTLLFRTRRSSAFPALRERFGLLVPTLGGLSLLWLLGFTILVGDRLHSDDAFRSMVISVGMWGLLGAAALGMIGRGYVNRSITLGRRDAAFVAFFVATFFAFASFGIIGGYRTDSHNPSLYWLLYRTLPGFDSMRAVYRFGIVANLFIAILAALTVTAAVSRIGSQTLRAAVLALVLLAVSVEEKLSPYAPSIDGPRPEVYDALDRLPGKEAVVGLPFFSPIKSGLQYSRAHTAYMLWTLPSERPIMSGWSSLLPRYYQF